MLTNEFLSRCFAAVFPGGKYSHGALVGVLLMTERAKKCRAGREENTGERDNMAPQKLFFLIAFSALLGSLTVKFKLRKWWTLLGLLFYQLLIGNWSTASSQLPLNMLLFTL